MVSTMTNETGTYDQDTVVRFHQPIDIIVVDDPNDQETVSWRVTVRDTAEIGRILELHHVDMLGREIADAVGTGTPHVTIDPHSKDVHGVWQAMVADSADALRNAYGAACDDI